MTALKPGVLAPDFPLRTTPDQKVSLADFRGQPAVLACYPADWSPVCSDRLSLGPGGIGSEVDGTPAFFVDGTRFDGAPDYASLLASLESELDQSGR